MVAGADHLCNAGTGRTVPAPLYDKGDKMKEKILEHTTPNSPDAEQAIIGSLFDPSTSKDKVKEILEILTPDDFYGAKRAKLFSICATLLESTESLDLIITRQCVQDNYTTYSPDDLLLELIECHSRTDYVITNLISYVNIVKEKAERRRALQNFRAIINDLDNDLIPVSNSLEKAEMTLDYFNNNGNHKKRSIENLGEFITREKTKTPYIIEGLIPDSGFSTIAGFTGMGKSSLTVQMLLSIICNRPFLNKFKILNPEVHILYINLENSEYTIDRLINAQLNEFKISASQMKQLFIPSCIGMSFDDRKDYNTISGWIEDNHIEIVVVDPILDAFGGDQNDLTVVRSLIKKLRHLNSNVSWVLLHHFNKGNDDIDIVRLMLGSVGFANAMTTIMGLKRMAKNTNPRVRTLEFGKTRDFEKPEPIMLEMDQKSRVYYTIESRDEAKPLDTTIVVSVLEDFGQMTYTKLCEQVAEFSGASINYSKILVGKARASHLITEVGGMYRPATKPLFPSYLEMTKQ